jgi:hypothetical protein
MTVARSLAHEALAAGFPQPDTSYRFTAEMKLPHPWEVFVLEPRGRVAMPMLCQATLLLLDKNLISHAKKLFADPERIDLQPIRWWLEQISPTTRVNVVLAAFEASERKVPSLEEFCAQLEEDMAAVGRWLPHLVPTPFDAGHLMKVYEMFREKEERREREMRFLRRVAPLVCNRRSAKDLSRVCSEILELAATDGLLARGSLAVLSALSCLYEGNDSPCIARKVLKPSEQYEDGDAHNALSDLHALEFLVAAHALPWGESAAICTCDLAVAQLWSELQPYPTEAVDGKPFRMNVTLSKALFPRLEDEKRAALMHRMADA